MDERGGPGSRCVVGDSGLDVDVGRLLVLGQLRPEGFIGYIGFIGGGAGLLVLGQLTPERFIGCIDFIREGAGLLVLG